MGFRFRRSISIAPGIRITANKNSIGISAGPKGAHVSINTKGQTSKSIGIPGTGISYNERGHVGAGKNKPAHEKNTPRKEAPLQQLTAEKPKEKPTPQHSKKYSRLLMILGIVLIVLGTLAGIGICADHIVGGIITIIIFCLFGFFMIGVSSKYSTDDSKTKAAADTSQSQNADTCDQQFEMDPFARTDVADDTSGSKDDANARPDSVIDPADEIRKFKGLLDDGIITPEEFESKKKELLNM